MRTDQFFVNLDRDNVDVHTFQLNQNYPNPFNPNTRISFEIRESGFVKLQVFNIAGQLVKTLVNNVMPQGQHTIDFAGNDFASGMYLYRLQTDNGVQTRKMLLVK